MKYRGGKNERAAKYRKYKLTDSDRDIILSALQNRIDYLNGSIMLLKDYADKDDRISVLYEQLRVTSRVKDILDI